MKIPDISVVSSSDIVGSESCREEDFNEISDGDNTPRSKIDVKEDELFSCGSTAHHNIVREGHEDPLEYSSDECDTSTREFISQTSRGQAINCEEVIDDHSEFEQSCSDNIHGYGDGYSNSSCGVDSNDDDDDFMFDYCGEYQRESIPHLTYSLDCDGALEHDHSQDIDELLGRGIPAERRGEGNSNKRQPMSRVDSLDYDESSISNELSNDTDEEFLDHDIVGEPITFQDDDNDEVVILETENDHYIPQRLSITSKPDSLVQPNSDTISTVAETENTSEENTTQEPSSQLTFQNKQSIDPSELTSVEYIQPTPIISNEIHNIKTSQIPLHTCSAESLKTLPVKLSTNTPVRDVHGQHFDQEVGSRQEKRASDDRFFHLQPRANELYAIVGECTDDTDEPSTTDLEDILSGVPEESISCSRTPSDSGINTLGPTELGENESGLASVNNIDAEKEGQRNSLDRNPEKNCSSSCESSPSRNSSFVEQDSLDNESPQELSSGNNRDSVKISPRSNSTDKSLLELDLAGSESVEYSLQQPTHHLANESIAYVSDVVLIDSIEESSTSSKQPSSPASALPSSPSPQPSSQPLAKPSSPPPALPPLPPPALPSSSPPALPSSPPPSYPVLPSTPSPTNLPSSTQQHTNFRTSYLSHPNNSYDYFSQENVYFIDSCPDQISATEEHTDSVDSLHQSSKKHTPQSYVTQPISLTESKKDIKPSSGDNEHFSPSKQPGSTQLPLAKEVASYQTSIESGQSLFSIQSNQVKGLQELTYPLHNRSADQSGILTRLEHCSNVASKSPSLCSLVDSLDVSGSPATSASVPSLISQISNTPAIAKSSNNNSTSNSVQTSKSKESIISDEHKENVLNNQYFAVDDHSSEEIIFPLTKNTCIRIEEHIDKQSVNCHPIQDDNTTPNNCVDPEPSNPTAVELDTSMEDHVSRVTRYVDGCIQEAMRYHASTPRTSLSSCESTSSVESALATNCRVGEIYTAGEYTGISGATVSSGDNDSSADFYALVETVRGVGMQSGTVGYNVAVKRDDLDKDLARTCSTGNTSTAVLHDLSSCGSSEGESCRQRRLLMEGSSGGSSIDEDKEIGGDNCMDGDTNDVDGVRFDDGCNDDGDGEDDGYCTLAHVMRAGDRDQHALPSRTTSNLSMLVNVDAGELESMAAVSVFGTIEDGDEENGVIEFDDDAIRDSSRSGVESDANEDGEPRSNEVHDDVDLTERERRQVRFCSLEQSDRIELVGDTMDNAAIDAPIKPTSQRMDSCKQRRRSFQDTRVTGFDVAPENQQMRAAVRAKQRQLANKDHRQQQQVSTYAFRDADIQVLGLQPAGSVPRRLCHLPSRHCISSLDILINPLSCSDSDARSGNNPSESDSDESSLQEESVDGTDNIHTSLAAEFMSCEGCNWKQTEHGHNSTDTVEYPTQCKLGQACARITYLDRINGNYPIDRGLSFSLSLSGSHIPLVNDQSEKHRDIINVMNRSISEDKDIEEFSDIVTSSSRTLDNVENKVVLNIDQKCGKRDNTILGRLQMVDDQTQTVDLSEDDNASRIMTNISGNNRETKCTGDVTVDMATCGTSTLEAAITGMPELDGSRETIPITTYLLHSDTPSSDTFFSSSNSSSSSSSSYTDSDERHLALREQLAISSYANRAGRIRVLDETTDSSDTTDNDSDQTSSSSAEGDYRYVPIETTHQELLQGIATLVMADYDDEEGTSDESSVDPEEWSEDELDAQQLRLSQSQAQEQHQEQPASQLTTQQQPQVQQQLEDRQLRNQSEHQYATHQSYEPIQRPNRPNTAHRPILTNGPTSHDSIVGWHNGVNGIADNSRMYSDDEDESLGGEYGNSTVEPVYHHRVRSTNGEVDSADSDVVYEDDGEDLDHDDDEDEDDDGDDEDLILMFNIATQTLPIHPQSLTNAGSLTVSTSSIQETQTSPRGITTDTQTTLRYSTRDTQTIVRMNVADTQTSPRNETNTTQITQHNITNTTQTTPRENTSTPRSSPLQITTNTQTIPLNNTNTTQTSPRNSIHTTRITPIQTTSDTQTTLGNITNTTQTTPRNNNNTIQNTTNTQTASLRNSNTPQTTPNTSTTHATANIQTSPMVNLQDTHSTVEAQTTPITSNSTAQTALTRTTGCGMDEDNHVKFNREDSFTQTCAAPILVDTAVSASPPARRFPSIFSSAEYSSKPPTPRIVVSQNEPIDFGEIDSVEVVTREVGVSLCKHFMRESEEVGVSQKEVGVSPREMSVSPRDVQPCYRQGVYEYVEIIQPISRSISLEAEPLPDENYVHEEEVTVEELTLNLDLITGDSTSSNNKDEKSQNSPTTEVSLSSDLESTLDNELSRLRRERLRILSIIAKDSMPSKVQVELAEAQLNYIIGQTDTLLSSLNDPSATLQSITNAEEPVIKLPQAQTTSFRLTLEKSRAKLDEKIAILESAAAIERQKKIDRSSSSKKQVAREVPLASPISVTISKTTSHSNAPSSPRIPIAYQETPTPLCLPQQYSITTSQQATSPTPPHHVPQIGQAKSYIQQQCIPGSTATSHQLISSNTPSASLVTAQIPFTSATTTSATPTTYNTPTSYATPPSHACSPYEQRAFNFQTEVDLKPAIDESITCLSINIAQTPTMLPGLSSPAFSAVGSDIHSQHGSSSSVMTPRQRREYLIAVRKGIVENTPPASPSYSSIEQRYKRQLNSRSASGFTLYKDINIDDPSISDIELTKARSRNEIEKARTIINDCLTIAEQVTPPLRSNTIGSRMQREIDKSIEDELTELRRKYNNDTQC